MIEQEKAKPELHKVMQEMQKEYDLPRDISKVAKTESQKLTSTDLKELNANVEQHLAKVVKEKEESSISVKEAKVRAENEAVAAYQAQEDEHMKQILAREMKKSQDQKVKVQAAHKDTIKDSKLVNLDQSEQDSSSDEDSD